MVWYMKKKQNKSTVASIFLENSNFAEVIIRKKAKLTTINLKKFFDTVLNDEQIVDEKSRLKSVELAEMNEKFNNDFE